MEKTDDVFWSDLKCHELKSFSLKSVIKFWYN